MKRKYFSDLHEWIDSNNRKPLVIRGARQVGKTWLVRYFAEARGLNLIELNFEKNPSLNSFFKTNDPKQILLHLEASFGKSFTPARSLLFLDEIQVVPELLAKLRWFAEDLPELPVIAAGSLLEFVLEKHSFSMPVGRINYMHMEPLSFEEFLIAVDKQSLFDYLHTFHLKMEVPEALHLQLMGLFKEYLIVGGMPAVVASWATDRSLTKVSQIQYDLLATYRDDFAKYNGRMDIERLDEVFRSIPKLLGGKFVYSKVNPQVRSVTVKQALDLLCKAKIGHRVNSCYANGLPLGSEIHEKVFKLIFLDVGLCSSVLGLTLNQITSIDEIGFINKGAIAEQVVGQLLRTINPAYMEPELYYWVREEKGASAEIDYVIQSGSEVLPIEIKAGSTGSLKSLHLFMRMKKLKKALRINSDIPHISHVEVKDPMGNEAHYSLHSIPFYLIGQLQRLLKV